jgi:hypothetical protein
MTNDLSDTITPEEMGYCNDPRPKMPSDFIWKYAPLISIHHNIPIDDAIEIAKEIYDTLEKTITRF